MSKKKCPEFENHERWLVSYADMLTLLFAVFVVLFALKEGGEPQVQKAAGSMQESFNTPLADIPVDRRSGPANQGFGIFEHFHGDQIRPPLIIKYPATKKRVAVIEEEMARLGKNLEERLYGPEKFTPKKVTGHARIISVHRTEQGFKVRLLARHFYKEGELRVRRAALAELDKVLQLLKETDRMIRVEGHTDSLPPPGDLGNWEVSALRASHVVRRMLNKFQFPNTRLSIAAYADTRPLAHNGSAEGRSLNRRIEFHVRYDNEYGAIPSP